MTNDELRADMLADPATADLAEEQGMTVDEYIAETLKYLDDPDAGFCGGRDSPDCEEGHLDSGSGFDAAAAPVIPGVRPGEGVAARGAVLPRRIGLVRG